MRILVALVVFGSACLAACQPPPNSSPDDPDDPIPREHGNLFGIDPPPAPPEPTPPPTPPPTSIAVECHNPPASDDSRVLPDGVEGKQLMSRTDGFVIFGNLEASPPSAVVFRGFLADGTPDPTFGCDGWTSVTFANRSRGSSSPVGARRVHGGYVVATVIAWPEGVEPSRPVRELALFVVADDGSVSADSLRILQASSPDLWLMQDADGLLLIDSYFKDLRVHFRARRLDSELNLVPHYGGDGAVLLGPVDTFTEAGDGLLVASAGYGPLKLAKVRTAGDSAGETSFSTTIDAHKVIRDAGEPHDLWWDTELLGLTVRSGRDPVVLLRYENYVQDVHEIVGRILIAFDETGALDTEFGTNGGVLVYDCARAISGTTNGFRMVGVREYTTACTAELSHVGSEISRKDLATGFSSWRYSFAGDESESLLAPPFFFPDIR